MFIYLCQVPPCFPFTKKVNNWKLEKVHLVVSGCLLLVCGCLLIVCGRLLVVCWSFVIVCSGLWSLPVLVTTNSKLHMQNNLIISTFLDQIVNHSLHTLTLTLSHQNNCLSQNCSYHNK